MMASSVLLLLLGVMSAVSAESGVKIIGGEKVDIRKVPWTASVTLFEKHFRCGAVVISEHWLLSAAHCFPPGLEARAVTVRVGSNNHASGGRKFTVEQVINYESYRVGCQNDIALLKMSEPIVFDESVARAELPTAGSPPPAVNTKLLVSGWGRTKNHRATPDLMAVEVEVVDFSGCQKQSDLNPNETVHICAFTEGKDSCTGDSGGPLVDGNVVVGVVSCGDPKCGTLPVVYTKVLYFRDWINKHTGL